MSKLKNALSIAFNAQTASFAQLRYSLEKELHPLKFVSLELSKQCNLACRHCYMEAGEPSPEELSFSEITNFVNMLKTNYGRRIFLSLTGGEPLCRKDIFEILAYIKKQGLRSGIVSNGLLLTEEIIKRLQALVDSISISLDGLEEGHNYLRQGKVFAQTVENIKLTRASGIRSLSIKTGLYKGNLAEIEELSYLIESIEPDIWHVFPVEPFGRGALNTALLLSRAEYVQLHSMFRKFSRERKLIIIFAEESLSQGSLLAANTQQQKQCSAGITSCAVLYNGEVVNCVCSRAVPQGNIRSADFSLIWEKGFLDNRKGHYCSCGKHYYEKS